jgi:uncharacterized protein YjiS (DUF1127 family)
MERQRSEATAQAREAQASLTNAVEQSRKMAEGQIRQDLERMLDELLRDVKAIGDRLSESE